MKIIPMYASVDTGYEINTLTLGAIAWLYLELLRQSETFGHVCDEWGAVVVVRQDVHDALLQEESADGLKFIISNAALQTESAARDAHTAEPFTETYFARIDVGLAVVGRDTPVPPMFRFTLNIGEPTSEGYKSVVIADACEVKP